jgi:hypothetical protein
LIEGWTLDAQHEKTRTFKKYIFISIHAVYFSMAFYIKSRRKYPKIYNEWAPVDPKKSDH